MSNIQKYEISLKCFLKNNNGEALILKTPNDSSFKGMYDFPGGRIDDTEFEINYLDILQREIKEETGIENVIFKKDVVAIARHKIFASERKSIKEDNFIFYIFFEGFLDNKSDIKISNEHLDYKWLKIEEIEKLEEYFMGGYLEAVKMYLNK